MHLISNDIGYFAFTFKHHRFLFISSKNKILFALWLAFWWALRTREVREIDWLKVRRVRWCCTHLSHLGSLHFLFFLPGSSKQCIRLFGKFLYFGSFLFPSILSSIIWLKTLLTLSLLICALRMDGDNLSISFSSLFMIIGDNNLYCIDLLLYWPWHQQQQQQQGAQP